MIISFSSYILLILVTCTLSLSAQTPVNQTDAWGLRQGIWQKNYPNGNLMYQGAFRDNRPVGEWKRYFEEGGLKALLQYSETSDSVKAKLYESGSFPVAEGTYVREKKEGIWVYYSGETKIAEESFFNGLKNGICRKYYPSGELLEESVWKNNKKEGKYQAFFQSGKPYLQCFYAGDRRNGRCFSYYSSGMTEVESTYKDDLPEGEWKYLGEDGSVRYTLIYDKGVLKNPQVLLNLTTRELDDLDKQRGRLDDPEKYLQNPEEYLQRKR